MNTPNTGLQDNARLAVADALKGVLADTYMLYNKTHGYHWNVTGPQFRALHLMFEEQYREMWEALDEIAERIRALGVFAPAGGKAFAELASISDDDSEPPADDQMIRNLLEAHETLIRRARKALAAAEEAGDVASEDLITQRIDAHEKTAWMLRSLSR